MAGAFLPRCLLKEGNRRFILQRASAALDLNGHGLMRLTL